jgi:hypothetical protein
LAAFADIAHGVFTRAGGFSTGDFQSLNVGRGVADSETAVKKNREAVLKAMGARDMVFLDQIHSADVVIFRKHDQVLSASLDSQPTKADAMVTDIPGKFLAVQMADCQAVLLYDPRRNVVGAVHSGWRGSIANITGACINAMKTDFGCRPEDILAGVSPSLGPCCGEFRHYQREIPESLWRFKIRSHYFDFWAMTRHQLLCAGLLPENMEMADICTKCNPHLFYSYRANQRTGRFSAVIGLK